MLKPLILSIEGITLSKEEISLFEEHAPLGIILFKRNIESHQQLSDLTQEIKSLNTPHTPWIFTDQEGGRVQRLRPPIGDKAYPIANIFEQDYTSNPRFACRQARVSHYELMRELSEYNIDSPCAPCCDISYPETHDVIGDRSFSSTHNHLVNLAKASMQGIIDAGGLPVIKHIPGHGRAICDSHLELPIVECSLEELEESDFLVFKELAPYAKLAMTAHILFPALDAEQPVTLSSKAIEYIRKEIGFSGLIMTDDISMKALSLPLGELTKKSLEAGCDIVLYCHGKLNELMEICSACPELSAVETIRYNQLLSRG